MTEENKNVNTAGLDCVTCNCDKKRDKEDPTSSFTSNEKLSIIDEILSMASDTCIEDPAREAGFYSGILTSIQTVLEM